MKRGHSLLIIGAEMTVVRTGLACAALIAILLAPATAWAQEEEVVYFHTDAIGSVRMITSATGIVIGRYDFMPFGEVWPANPPAPTESRQFTGAERDADTKLDYFGARYYRPLSGRFTTVDPDHLGADIFDPQSWNAYSYARNNPFRYADPTGLYPCSIRLSGADAVAAGVTDGASVEGECVVAEDPWKSAQRFFLEIWLNFEQQLPRTAGFLEGSTQAVTTLFTSPARSCLALFAGQTVRNLSPLPLQSSPSLGDFIVPAADVGSIVAWNQSLRYAASRPNYLGGQGLLYPMKSSVYRNLAARSSGIARAGLVGHEMYAIFAGLQSEWAAAKSGQCR